MLADAVSQREVAQAGSRKPGFRDKNKKHLQPGNFAALSSGYAHL